MKYQAPRGTQDFLQEQTRKLDKLLYISKKLFDFYGFNRILTPSFEHTELFLRSVGESSDIVNKEMYTFLDKSDRSLTLRPELTAGLIRAYIENSLHREPKPVKIWSFGPAFRYERPQVGRYRQFYQLDAEVLGDSSPYCEAENIHLLSSIFNNLGIDYRLEINTIGDVKTRESYKEYFKNYAREFLDKVCDDCKKRYEQNPLRMLDCKIPADQELYSKTKKPIDFLSEESLSKWNEIKQLIGFDSANKKIAINPNLVRGLDYYNDFVFEFKSTSPLLKEQNSICGGGRYDSLVEILGGPDTPGFGWAVGIERILMIMDAPKKQEVSLAIITTDSNVGFISSELFSSLEKNNVKATIHTCYRPKNVLKQIEAAVKRNIDYIILRLDDEIRDSKIQIKDVQKHHQAFYSCENINELVGQVNKYLLEQREIKYANTNT